MQYHSETEEKDMDKARDISEMYAKPIKKNKAQKQNSGGKEYQSDSVPLDVSVLYAKSTKKPNNCEK